MFLRKTRRHKDGKTHEYYSVVENRRVAGGRHIQHTLLYLGEISDGQKKSWNRAIDVVEGNRTKQMTLFPEGTGADQAPGVTANVRLDQLALDRPRQWGACWLACELWETLGLRSFWHERLGTGYRGVHWERVLLLLSAYRLIDPGSEWHLHRIWFDKSAMGDLLGEGFRIAGKDRLYRCHDRLLEYKDDLFGHLKRRWEELFEARHDILLYDLTSTYFESPPPDDPEDKRRHGYSRDKRSDCVQVVIALVVTPDGLPLSYEVLHGNTADSSTLKDFLAKIEALHGKARRVWVMDRGIPTEQTLEEMRKTGVQYLVGTPKGRLTKLEGKLAGQAWEQARDQVQVRLVESEGETYIHARSQPRAAKEHAMRQRRLRKLLDGLGQLREASRPMTRDNLLLKVGGLKKEAGRAYHLLKITLPKSGEAISPETFHWKLDMDKYRKTWRREGSYLLRTNLPVDNAGSTWEHYLRLTEIEEAFRNLKGDLAVRPVHHSAPTRIEAHIFVSFLAYCLHVTLRMRCKRFAPGLTPRSVLEQLSGMQMVDVLIPTTDGRMVKMSRYTRPDKAQQLLLSQLQLTLPKQPPPEISQS